MPKTDNQRKNEQQKDLRYHTACSYAVRKSWDDKMENTTIPQVHVVKMVRETKRQKYTVNGDTAQFELKGLLRERQKAEKTEAVRVGYQ